MDEAKNTASSRSSASRKEQTEQSISDHQTVSASASATASVSVSVTPTATASGTASASNALELPDLSLPSSSTPGPEHIETASFMSLAASTGATKKRIDEKKVSKKSKGVTFSLTSGKSNAMENFKDYEEEITVPALESKNNKLNVKASEFVPESKKTHLPEAPRFCHTVRYPQYDTCPRYQQYPDNTAYPLYTFPSSSFSNVRGCYFHTFTNENFNYRSIDDATPKQNEIAPYGENLDHGDEYDPNLDPYPSFYDKKGNKVKHFPVLRKDEEELRDKGFPLYDKDGNKSILFEQKPSEQSILRIGPNTKAEKSSSECSYDDEKVTNPEYDSRSIISDSTSYNEADKNTYNDLDIISESTSLPVPDLDLNGLNSENEMFMEDSEPIFRNAKKLESCGTFADQAEHIPYTNKPLKDIPVVNEARKLTTQNQSSPQLAFNIPELYSDPEIVIKFKPFTQGIEENRSTHSLSSKSVQSFSREEATVRCNKDDQKENRPTGTERGCNCNCHERFKLGNENVVRGIPGLTLHVFWERNYLHKD